MKPEHSNFSRSFEQYHFNFLFLSLYLLTTEKTNEPQIVAGFSKVFHQNK